MAFSEQQPFNKSESREGEPQLCEVVDIYSYFGVSRDQVIEACLQSLEQFLKEDGDHAEEYRKKLDLTDDSGQEEQRKQIEDKLDEYTEKFSSKIERLRQVGNHCVQFARDQGYINQDRRANVVIAGTKLEGLMPQFANLKYGSGRYFIKSNVAILGIDCPESVFRHEIGHMLSARHEKKEFGLYKFDKIPEDNDFEGDRKFPSWLDEGATEIWADESRIGDEEEPYNDFRGKAMRIVMEKIGLDKDHILKAYFGDDEAYQLIDQRVRKRYNLSFDDLACLNINYNPDFLNKVLDGDPVELKLRKGADSPTMLPGMKRLAEKFPNVTVNIVEHKK